MERCEVVEKPKEVPEDVSAKLVEFDGKMQVWEKPKITSIAAYKEVSERKAELVVYRKFFSNKRLEITRQIDKSKRLVIDFFDIPLNRIKLKDEEATKEMLRFDDEEKAKAKEREDQRIKDTQKKVNGVDKQIGTAAKNGNIEKVEKLEEKKESIAKDPSVKPRTENINKNLGTYRVDIWHHKVINVTLLPDEYTIKIADNKKLDALAKSSKGTAVIPGVMFYKTDDIRVRTK